MFSNLSAQQLRRAAAIKEQLDSLQSELDRLLGSSSSSNSGKKTMSPAARAKIAAAQKARWAKANQSKAATTGRRKMSAAARAKIAAAAKTRWAKAKAAGKKSL